MKKIINDPDAFVDEVLEGLVLAYPRTFRRLEVDGRAVVRAAGPKAGKVGIVTGGGSGHLPVFVGYVGQGLLDGCAVGDVFASPNPERILAVTQAVHGGAGVLYLYGNYGGDVMNFDMAAELAAIEEIDVQTVLVADDVASAPRSNREARRGVAGMVFLFKIAGAAAEEGRSLGEVAAVAKKVNERVGTMGVALTPVILPAVGHATFEIGPNEMEIGMGIHGEPGIRRGELQSADTIAETLVFGNCRGPFAGRRR